MHDYISINHIHLWKCTLQLQYIGIVHLMFSIINDINIIIFSYNRFQYNSSYQSYQNTSRFVLVGCSDMTDRQTD